MGLWDALANGLMQNLTGITYLIIGSVLGMIAAWLPARYSWKAQRADQRRASVYAPLFDELHSVKRTLEEYRNPVRTEYDRIRSEHLIYLVPKQLRAKIYLLYMFLRLFGTSAVDRQVEYQQRILDHLNEVAIPPATSSNQSNAKTLAIDLSGFLVAGEIPLDWMPTMESLFESVKLSGFRITEASVGEYFRKLLSIRKQDAEMQTVDGRKKRCLELLESVGKTIAKDLDAEW